MKTRIQLQSLPDAIPLPNVVVTVRSIETGTTLDTVTSDPDTGFVTLERDGHLEPYYFYINSLPGGDKFWRSDEMMAGGPTSPWDWPAALIPLGNGVVAGYLDELAVSVNSTNVTVLSGGAVVLGHPFVQYDSPPIFIITRPVSGTRIDRAVVRLYPGGSATTPGKADIAIITGADTIGTVPDLTQTATVYELPLARITVPNAGTLSVDDERQMLSAERHAPVTDQVTVDGPIVTDEAGGEALSGLRLTLSLPDEGTYDITATVSGAQGPVAGSTAWARVATYGPTLDGLAISNPGQVAAAVSGFATLVAIADTGNNRLVIYNTFTTISSSITGLTNITGVCFDSSGNIYVVTNGSPALLKKYNSSLVLQYSNSLGPNVARHICTDNTHLYLTINDGVIKVTVAGAYVTGWGTSGSGDGQFNTPWGIAYNATDALLYVVDRQTQDRVQASNTSGTYQRKWTINDADTTAYGINADASGDIFVSSIQLFDSDGIVRRTTNAGVAIDSFTITGGVATGVGVSTGDIVWLANDTTEEVEKWDEVTAGAGYGQLAVEIDGSVGTYVGAGNRDTAMKVVGTGSKVGGYGTTVVVRGFAKATTGDATFKSLSLSAEARSRR